MFKTLKKYINIYKIMLKYSLIEETAYATHFITQVVVEVGYALILIVFFQVIYSNVSEIAGWSYYQILFLTGLTIVASELFLGAVHIFNLRALPEKIVNGDVDFVLLKPYSSLFNLSLGHPYPVSFISAIPGLFLMLYALINLGLVPKLSDIVAGGAIFIGGFIIAYSMSVIFASLTFVFINGRSIAKIGDHIVGDYGSFPHTIYRGGVRFLFFFIIPVVFISSVPAATILTGLEVKNLIYAYALSTLFLFIAVKVWNYMIKFYSSASS